MSKQPIHLYLESDNRFNSASYPNPAYSQFDLNPYDDLLNSNGYVKAVQLVSFEMKNLINNIHTLQRFEVFTTSNTFYVTVSTGNYDTSEILEILNQNIGSLVDGFKASIDYNGRINLTSNTAFVIRDIEGTFISNLLHLDFGLSDIKNPTTSDLESKSTKIITGTHPLDLSTLDSIYIMCPNLFGHTIMPPQPPSRPILSKIPNQSNYGEMLYYQNSSQHNVVGTSGIIDMLNLYLVDKNLNLIDMPKTASWSAHLVLYK